MHAGEFESRRQLAKIGKPVDRTEWGMTPPTVNAYYNPSMNEMVFPAGILQPPFFNKAAVRPVNFGAIGMVMGHELTHGFDDEGRQFDAKGNLRDWWTPPVGKEFETRAQCVVDQYDGYVAVDDLHVNGKLTLGENIADLGGLKLAHAAYVTARGSKEPEKIGKWTDEQLFFLGHGAVVVHEAAAGDGADARDGRSALAAGSSRQWADVEPAGVRGGVPVQGGGQDGAQDAVHDLVALAARA